MTDKPAFDPSAAFSTSPPGFTSQSWEVKKPPFDPGAAFTTAAPLPDVGAPAIGDGGQFSPGVPAVNEEVERIARSANKNLIEPITHPIDTLTGLGRVGLGAAQYAGLP